MSAGRRAAVVAGLAALWLGIAADVLYGGPISSLDVWLAERMVAPRGSRLGLALLFWSHVHSHRALLVFGAVLALLLARRRAWPWAAGVIVALPGSMLLNHALKLAVQRSRPVLENPILALNTYSFPSGHTAASTAFYGVLAAYLAWRFPRYRALFLLASVCAVVLVAFSRMALGVHYFGDVLAAAASTGAWLVICLGGVHAWLSRRRA